MAESTGGDLPKTGPNVPHDTLGTVTSNSSEIWPQWGRCVGCFETAMKSTTDGVEKDAQEVYGERDFFILPCAHLVCSPQCLKECARTPTTSEEDADEENCNSKSRCPACLIMFVEAEVMQSKTIRPLEVIGRVTPQSLKLKKKCQGCIRPNALAAKFCEQCLLPLCQICVNRHAVMIDTTNHSVIDSPNIFELVSSSEVCGGHPNYRFTSFCNTCDLQLCQMCKFEGNHAQHDICDLKEFAQKTITELKTLYKEHSQMVDGLKTAHQNLLKKVSTLAEQTTKVKADTEVSVNRIKNLIDQQGLDVTEDIVVAVTFKVFRINLQNKCYKSLISQAQVFKLLSKIFDFGSGPLVQDKFQATYQLYTLMKQQFKYIKATTANVIENEPVGKIEINTDHQALYEALENLGKLQFSSSPAPSESESEDVNSVENTQPIVTLGDDVIPSISHGLHQGLPLIEKPPPEQVRNESSIESSTLSHQLPAEKKGDMSSIPQPASGRANSQTVASHGNTSEKFIQNIVADVSEADRHTKGAEVPIAFFVEEEDDSDDEMRKIKAEPVDYEDRDEEPPDDDENQNDEEDDANVLIVDKTSENEEYASHNSLVPFSQLQNGFTFGSTPASASYNCRKGSNTSEDNHTHKESMRESAKFIRSIKCEPVDMTDSEESCDVDMQEGYTSPTPLTRKTIPETKTKGIVTNVPTINNETMISSNKKKRKASNSENEFILPNIPSPFSDDTTGSDEFFKHFNPDFANSPENFPEPTEFLDPETGILFQRDVGSAVGTHEKSEKQDDEANESLTESQPNDTSNNKVDDTRQSSSNDSKDDNHLVQKTQTKINSIIRANDAESRIESTNILVSLLGKRLDRAISNQTNMLRETPIIGSTPLSKASHSQIITGNTNQKPIDLNETAKNSKELRQNNISNPSLPIFKEVNGSLELLKNKVVETPPPPTPITLSLKNKNQSKQISPTFPYSVSTDLLNFAKKLDSEKTTASSSTVSFSEDNGKNVPLKKTPLQGQILEAKISALLKKPEYNGQVTSNSSKELHQQIAPNPVGLNSIVLAHHSPLLKVAPTPILLHTTVGQTISDATTLTERNQVNTQKTPVTVTTTLLKTTADTPIVHIAPQPPQGLTNVVAQEGDSGLKAIPTIPNELVPLPLESITILTPSVTAPKIIGTVSPSTATLPSSSSATTTAQPRITWNESKENVDNSNGNDSMVNKSRSKSHIQKNDNAPIVPIRESASRVHIVRRKKHTGKTYANVEMQTDTPSTLSKNKPAALLEIIKTEPGSFIDPTNMIYLPAGTVTTRSASPRVNPKPPLKPSQPPSEPIPTEMINNQVVINYNETEKSSRTSEPPPIVKNLSIELPVNPEFGNVQRPSVIIEPTKQKETILQQNGSDPTKSINLNTQRSLGTESRQQRITGAGDQNRIISKDVSISRVVTNNNTPTTSTFEMGSNPTFEKNSNTSLLSVEKVLRKPAESQLVQKLLPSTNTKATVPPVTSNSAIKMTPSSSGTKHQEKRNSMPSSSGPIVTLRPENVLNKPTVAQSEIPVASQSRVSSNQSKPDPGGEMNIRPTSTACFYGKPLPPTATGMLTRCPEPIGQQDLIDRLLPRKGQIANTSPPIQQTGVGNKPGERDLLLTNQRIEKVPRLSPFQLQEARLVAGNQQFTTLTRVEILPPGKKQQPVTTTQISNIVQQPLGPQISKVLSATANSIGKTTTQRSQPAAVVYPQRILSQETQQEGNKTIPRIISQPRKSTSDGLLKSSTISTSNSSTTTSVTTTAASTFSTILPQIVTPITSKITTTMPRIIRPVTAQTTPQAPTVIVPQQVVALQTTASAQSANQKPVTQMSTSVAPRPSSHGSSMPMFAASTSIKSMSLPVSTSTVVQQVAPDLATTTPTSVIPSSSTMLSLSTSLLRPTVQRTSKVRPPKKRKRNRTTRFSGDNEEDELDDAANSDTSDMSYRPNFKKKRIETFMLESKRSQRERKKVVHDGCVDSEEAISPFIAEAKNERKQDSLEVPERPRRAKSDRISSRPRTSYNPINESDLGPTQLSITAGEEDMDDESEPNKTQSRTEKEGNNSKGGSLVGNRIGLNSFPIRSSSDSANKLVPPKKRMRFPSDTIVNESENTPSRTTSSTATVSIAAAVNTPIVVITTDVVVIQQPSGMHSPIRNHENILEVVGEEGEKSKVTSSPDRMECASALLRLSTSTRVPANVVTPITSAQQTQTASPITSTGNSNITQRTSNDDVDDSTSKHTEEEKQGNGAENVSVNLPAINEDSTTTTLVTLSQVQDGQRTPLNSSSRTREVENIKKGPQCQNRIFKSRNTPKPKEALNKSAYKNIYGELFGASGSDGDSPTRDKSNSNTSQEVPVVKRKRGRPIGLHKNSEGTQRDLRHASPQKTPPIKNEMQSPGRDSDYEFNSEDEVAPPSKSPQKQDGYDYDDRRLSTRSASFESRERSLSSLGTISPTSRTSSPRGGSRWSSRIVRTRSHSIESSSHNRKTPVSRGRTESPKAAGSPHKLILTRSKTPTSRPSSPLPSRSSTPGSVYSYKSSPREQSPREKSMHRMSGGSNRRGRGRGRPRNSPDIPRPMPNPNLPRRGPGRPRKHPQMDRASTALQQLHNLSSDGDALSFTNQFTVGEEELTKGVGPLLG
ncbi:uncharacterized threonine-rich GPI-anchored glycoprotein PJ4664.02 isoform X2 [Folsomia candida]|uniref:uncharacterized threonine-rich GPI-anchored glycoprotein PJ4664.02 isoform X2 n=1 Tax=Folsomia candida TaxID=158441 RepID=UPI000B8F36ED|nr:uncharacterized threonine-rich GPI-anchored glycoprotein PJ4664.02 isoform X2 [Folsomia candida]